MFSCRQLSVISMSSRCGGKSAVDQQLEQLLREPRIAQLDRRDVDRQRQRGIPLLGVFAAPGAISASDSSAITPISSAIGMNTSGLTRPSVRRVPPRQHLEADQLAGRRGRSAARSRARIRRAGCRGGCRSRARCGSAARFPSAARTRSSGSGPASWRGTSRCRRGGSASARRPAPSRAVVACRLRRCRPRR